jgi:RNA polymerase sigma factor (sigma-70 family)
VWKRVERPPSDAENVNWATVVDQIRAGDPAGEEALYLNLVSGARLFLQRRLGRQDIEDQVHDLFLIIVETIRRGDLREPERLMGFVRTILHRQLNAEISKAVRTRQCAVSLESAATLSADNPSPEHQTETHQKIELMKRVLSKMSQREFEILTRFYLREQPPERIQLDMGLTETQYHLLKSRAKARLTQLVQRKLSRNS